MAKQTNNSKPNSEVNPLEEEKCRICWQRITNRSLTDTCNHPFCLQCLRQWSQNHNNCPFCRRRFNSILANYNSETDFQIIPIPNHFQQEFVPLAQDMNEVMDLITRLLELQAYVLLQEEHHLNLLNSLNNVDPNDIEYIRVYQNVINAEERIQNSNQLIGELRVQLRNAVLQRNADQQNNPNVEENNQQNEGQNENNGNEDQNQNNGNENQNN